MTRCTGTTRWKLAAIVAGLTLAAGFALGQYRIGHGVWIMDPMAGVQNAMTYLLARIETLETDLQQEVAARQALEREVNELKRARAAQARTPTRTAVHNRGSR